MKLYFFKSDLSKLSTDNWVFDNPYFKDSLAPYYVDRESFLGSLVTVPFQIFFEEIVYAAELLANTLQGIGEVCMGLTTSQEATAHFNKAGDHFTHMLCYLTMMVITPFVALARPFIRVAATIEHPEPAPTMST